MTDMDRFDPLQKPDALKKLAQHLSALNAEGDINMESDMLSLIISGILNGEDIAHQYPTFYQTLLENSDLRQAFLDVLASIESERAGELIPIPDASQTSLGFLDDVSDAAALELLDTQKWRATWQRTMEQLRTIFSPPELAYRAEPNFSEDPWFTLLREEIQAEGITYDVLLDCVLSSENEGALSTSLSLAVTLSESTGHAEFPLRANLTWGDYHESILLDDEGRFQFPDIPIASVFDATDSQPKADLLLTLETALS